MKFEHFQQVFEMKDGRKLCLQSVCLLLIGNTTKSERGRMYTSSLGTHFLLHRSSLLKPEHSKVTPSCNCMPLRARHQELIVCVCVCESKGEVGVRFSAFPLLGCHGSRVEELV